MTGYLLDTNVVSEMTRRQPSPGVARWLSESPTTFLSILTIGELRRGVLRQQQRSADQASRLTEWLARLEQNYASSLIGIDMAVIARWAALPVNRTLPVIDSLLAATALTHDLIVATRNVRDFSGTSVRTFDPFSAG